MDESRHRLGLEYLEAKETSTLFICPHLYWLGVPLVLVKMYMFNQLNIAIYKSRCTNVHMFLV